MPVPVFIQVLGGFRLRTAGRDVASLPRKAQALLAYLAMQDGRAVSREAVSDLLWSRSGTEQARHSLRQALLVLRRVLPGAITGDAQMLGLVPEVVDSDIARFRARATAATRAELAEAAELHAGPLLDGFPPVAEEFDDWLRTARGGVLDQAVDVMRRLVAACLADGDAQPAVQVAERMLALDPLREDSHRLLMEAYLRAGRRADAVRQYDACAAILRKELDVAPAAETEALYRQLMSEARSEPTALRPLLDHGFRFSDGPPRVAVLPFHQPGGAPLPDHLADGLVEDIICQLAGLRELTVISHGTTSMFRDPRTPIAEIGRAVDARYVVRGTIRRSGPSIRLNTELTEVATSRVVWARTHDAAASLTFDDQDRIVAQIIHSLTPKVQETEIMRIRGKRIDDLSIHEKVLLARDHLNRLGRDNFLAAQRIMEDVIATGPAWGEAYAVAADCHGLLLAEGWSTQRDHHVAEIERLSRIALDLDRNNVRALTFYAHRRTIFHHDFGTATELFRRALDAAPGSAPAWLWSSITYSHLGDGAEAVHRAQRALSLSPADRQAYWFYLALCMAYYAGRDYAAAADWGVKALAEPATGRTGPRRVAAALAAAGRLAEARDLGRRIIAEDPTIRVRRIVAQSTFQDPARREEFGRHLLAAGIPE